MSKTQYDVDICIIGAGSAGLSVASGAAHVQSFFSKLMKWAVIA